MTNLRSRLRALDRRAAEQGRDEQSQMELRRRIERGRARTRPGQTWPTTGRPGLSYKERIAEGRRRALRESRDIDSAMTIRLEATNSKEETR